VIKNPEQGKELFIKRAYGIGHKGDINIPNLRIAINYTKGMDINDFLLDY